MGVENRGVKERKKIKEVKEIKEFVSKSARRSFVGYRFRGSHASMEITLQTDSTGDPHLPKPISRDSLLE